MAYVADRTRVVIARSRYGWRTVIESQATIESDAENLPPTSRHPRLTLTSKMTPLSAMWLCPWRALRTCLDSVGVHSTYTTAWRRWYKRREWTGRQLCCRRASLGRAECHRCIDGIGRHGTRWRQRLSCNTRRTAADQVRIPGVLPLPGWFQKTDAALASQTVSGPVDMTESKIVQSQTLRTLSAAALSVSRDRP